MDDDDGGIEEVRLGLAKPQPRKTAWQKGRAYAIPLAIAMVLDLATSFLIYGAIHEWDFELWKLLLTNPKAFGIAMSNAQHDTIDVIVSALIRFVLLTLFTFFGARYGSVVHAPDRKSKKKQFVGDKNGKDPSRSGASGINGDVEDGLGLNGHGPENASERTPLLQPAAEPLRASPGSVPAAPPSKPMMSLKDLLKTEDRNMKLRESADKRAYASYVFTFILCAGSMVHIGIKCILFQFPNAHFHNAAVLMCSLVVWMTLELFLSRSLIEALIHPEGHLIPNLHLHPLYYTEVFGNWCDLCRTRIRERRAYRCRLCDYDLCIPCARKQDRNRGEGVMRGDKGVREETEISVWTYVKKGIRFARPHWWLVAIATAMTLVSSVAQLVLPRYQGNILDNVVNRDNDAFKDAVLLFMGSSVAVGLFGGLQSLCFSLLGLRMLIDVRTRLYRSILQQDIAYFDGASTGDLTSRMSGDAYAMISPAQTALAVFLSNIIQVVGAVGMCFYTSWRLSVLALTTIGPIVMIYKVYARWARRISNEIWTNFGDGLALATSALGNIRTVRAFGTEKEEYDKFMRPMSHALKLGVRDAFVGAGASAITSYIDLGIGVLLLWYGGTVVINDEENPAFAVYNELTVGNLITFQLYINMVQNAYQSITSNVTSFFRAGGAAQRVLQLMDNLPDISPDHGLALKNVRGEIEFRDISFHYQMRPDQKVLKHLNLKIPAGSTCALVGKSGAGKSTLVHLLLRFYDPRSGTIFLDGRPLSDYNPVDLRRHIGLVSQDTQLFNLTVAENISYGVPDATQADVERAAKAANAHDFIMTFDDKYETKCGDNGVRLSGGQKQRISIARMMLRKPSLLFLDEATSALDSESESLVQAAIDTLLRDKKRTVILVAHRLSTVVNADIIAVVGDGAVIEQGTHDELLLRNGVYARLVARQLVRQRNQINEADIKKSADIDKVDDLLDEVLPSASSASSSAPAGSGSGSGSAEQDESKQSVKKDEAGDDDDDDDEEDEEEEEESSSSGES